MVTRTMPTKSVIHKKEQKKGIVRGVTSNEKPSRNATPFTHAADSREKFVACTQGDLLWLKFKLERRNGDPEANPWSLW